MQKNCGGDLESRFRQFGQGLRIGWGYAASFLVGFDADTGFAETVGYNEEEQTILAELHAGIHRYASDA